MPDALFHCRERIPVICRNIEADGRDFQRADAPVLLPHLFDGRQRILRRFPVKIRISVFRDFAGCIAGTAFAIALGKSGQEAVTTALTVGVPVAALGTQLDVLGKTTGSIFVHKMMDCSDKKDWKGMGVWMWASQIPFIGVWVLPIILLTTVGANYVEIVINAIPAWLNAGLNVASGMLPALGFAILLRQMPLKKYGYFLLAGFVMAAYLGMGMLAIAMVGVVICMFIFQMKEESNKQAASGAAVQGGDFEDE